MSLWNANPILASDSAPISTAFVQEAPADITNLFGFAWPTGWNDAFVTTMQRSLIAGLSTTLGAFVVLVLPRRPEPPHMAFALALAGGVMVTVSVVELWLPQLTHPSNLLENVFAAFVGVVSFLMLRYVVPEPEGIHPKAGHDEENSVQAHDGGAIPHTPSATRGRGWRLAVLLTFALTMHNFPEGVAVAVSSLESAHLGVVVTIAIAVHNIPEGIVIAMPVLDATGSKYRAIQLATMSGLAEPCGALLAFLLLPEWAAKGRSMDLLLCFVGGVMVCVALSELLPEALAYQCPVSTGIGFVVGATIMMLTHELA